jgi:hypothetical protein
MKNEKQKPIQSKDIKVNINRLKSLGIVNEYTGDLFGIEDCTNCDGSGQVPVKGKEHEERTEDCDLCNS